MSIKEIRRPDILNDPTIELDTDLVLAPDGLGGTEWVPAPVGGGGGGGGGDWVFIEEIVLGSDAANITFTDIPDTFKDLFVSYVVRSSHTADDNLYIRVGSGSLDAGATNYTSFAPYAGTTSGTINNTGAAFGWVGIIPGATSNAGYFCSGDITVQDYASTTKTRNLRGNSGFYDNGVSAYFVYDSWVTWKNTTQAIDTVRLYPMTGPNFKAGSTVALYGRGDMGGSGGGGGGGTDLDVSPTPTANDQEFKAALSGWTTVGSPDVMDANAAGYESQLRLSKAATGAFQIHGLHKPAPSMPFTVTASIPDYLNIANYQQHALMFTDGTKYFMWGPLFQSSNGVPELVAGVWASRTSRTTASEYTGTRIDRPKYLRVVVNSATSYDLWYSIDGQVWILMVAAYNPSLTPTGVGFGVTGNDNSTATSMVADWLRFGTGVVQRSDAILWQSVGGGSGGGAATPPNIATVSRTSGNLTLTNTSFAIIDSAFSLSLTTGASRVRVSVNAAVQGTALGVNNYLDVEVDGVRMGGTDGLVVAGTYSNGYNSVDFSIMTPALAAGAHTFKLMNRCSSSSGIWQASSTIPLMFQVEEVLGGGGGGGSSTLDGLTDVDLTVPPTNGQALVYETASSLWKAGSVAAAGGATAFIGALAYRTSNQTGITTETAIGLNAEHYDTDGFHNNSTNNSRMTIPAGMGGKYAIVGGSYTASIGSTNYIDTRIKKNGATHLATDRRPRAPDDNTLMTVSCIVELAAGDYVEVTVQSDDTSFDVGTGTNGQSNFLSIAKLDSGKVGAGIGAKAYNASVQSVAGAFAQTTLTLNSEAFDTDGFHSTSSNTERMTIPAGLGGKYLVKGGTYSSSFPAGKAVYLLLFKNGVEYWRAEKDTTANAAPDTLEVVSVVDLAAGDYVDLRVMHSDAASYNVGHASAASVQTHLEIMRLDSGGGSGGGGSALTVQEADGTPIDTAVTKLIFPNESVSITGHEATIRQVPTGFIGAKATRITDQTGVGHSADTPVVYNGTEEFDTDGFHSTSVNPERMTIPAGLGGKYLLTANVVWDTTATGIRQLWFNVNGLAAVAYGFVRDNGTNSYQTQIATTVLNLAAGDYVYLVAHQDSGGSRTLSASIIPISFSIAKLDSGKVGAGIGAKATGATTTITSTPTEMLFPSEEFDTDGFHSTSSATGRMTVPAGLGGKYLVNGQVARASDAGGVFMDVTILKNGSIVAFVRSPQADYLHMQASVVLDLVPGDYVQLFGTTGTGSSATYDTFLSVMRLDSGSTSAPRTIRGVVAADGTIVYGSGFTVSHTSNNPYSITWTTPFATVPVVVVSENDNGGGVMRRVFTGYVGTDSVIVIATNSYGDNGWNNSKFSFIAMES